MREGHHEPVLASRDDGELGRKGFLANHEGMVSPGFEGLRQPVEESRARVRDPRALAMARRRGALDGASVTGGERLVSQTHAEQRHSRALGLRDHRNRSPRALGPARSRRDHDRAGPQRDDLVRLEAIVARDPDVGVQPAQGLDEVERERVVVVDHEDHANHSRARSIARKSAAALASASAYSFSATESATMPAPACTRQSPPSTTAVRIAMARSQLPAASK